MDVIDFQTYWDRKDEFRLIDVREADEFAEVRVKGAEHHALSKIKTGDFPEFDDRPVALICKMGGRSAMAGQLMEQAGLGPFTNVDGGTMAAVSMGEECVDVG